MNHSVAFLNLSHNNNVTLYIPLETLYHHILRWSLSCILHTRGLFFYSIFHSVKEKVSFDSYDFFNSIVSWRDDINFISSVLIAFNGVWSTFAFVMGLNLLIWFYYNFTMKDNYITKKEVVEMDYLSTDIIFSRRKDFQNDWIKIIDVKLTYIKNYHKWSASIWSWEKIVICIDLLSGKLNMREIEKSSTSNLD